MAAFASSRIAAQTPTSTKPTIVTQYQSLFTHIAQSHGLMAPLLRRKYLTCFYCNKRSDTIYDDLITRFDCAQCESTNYLDHNGEITDPPVATEEEAAPSNLHYSFSKPAPLSPAESEPNIFCARCLKNQHLYTASLSQYYVETDPHHPFYRQLERDYFTYKRNLEKTYPQVCMDCKPKVEARMKEAGTTAKADHLRRVMERSRARQFTTENTVSMENVGKYGWCLGLFGQILWNILSLVPFVETMFPAVFENHWFVSIAGSLRLIPILKPAQIGRTGLFLSIATLWWNPKFKQMNRGFANHIKGFRNWYQLQLLLLATRILFYLSARPSNGADPLSAATAGSHIFMAVFVLLLALKSRKSLKVDHTPLWGTTSDSLLDVIGPASQDPTNSSQSSSSMADALDQIMATPSKPSTQVSPPSSRPTSSKTRTPPSRGFSTYSTSGVRPLNGRSVVPPRRTSPSLLSMSEADSVRYLATGELPPNLQQQYSEPDLGGMEWTPTRPQKSQYRAFNGPQQVQNQPQVFGQTPAAETSSPFWFKVPPAPVAPAHKARNPPNQPRLRVISPEVKQNFFNSVTQRKTVEAQNPGKQQANQNEIASHDIAFAQQKFFLPASQEEPGNNLADLLTSFSLGSPQKSTRTADRLSDKPTNQRSHAKQAVILVMCDCLWYYTHQYQLETQNSQIIWLGVISACLFVAAYTLVESLLVRPGRKMDRACVGFSGSLALCECVMAAYGSLQVFAGNAGCEMCATQGVAFISVMMIHQIWLGSVGY